MFSLSRSLCGLSLALGIGLSSTAFGQETTVSPERPSQEAAGAFVSMMWDALPDDGVVIYFNCVRPGCRGQVPDWFTEEAWNLGLDAAGLELRSADVGLGLERLFEIREAFPAPPMLATRLATEIAQADPNARVLVFVHPNRNDRRLELSWELHDLAPPTVRDRGRLTVRLQPPSPPPPPPITTTPYFQRPVVWGGAGLILIGASAVGVSVFTDLSRETPQAELVSVGGWLGVMTGGMMMFIPAVRNHAHPNGFRFRF